MRNVTKKKKIWKIPFRETTGSEGKYRFQIDRCAGLENNLRLCLRLPTVAKISKCRPGANDSISIVELTPYAFFNSTMFVAFLIRNQTRLLLFSMFVFCHFASVDRGNRFRVSSGQGPIIAGPHLGPEPRAYSVGQ